MNQVPYDIEALIRKYALLNAYKHGGRAEPSPVMSKVLGERPELKPQVRLLINYVKEVVEKVNRMGVEEQWASISLEYPELLAEAPPAKPMVKTLPPLPDAEVGRVVTRFPPEPNGYPHIGHAKAVVIDETYAHMYNGRFILRFDDTNPAKERLEYYDAILEGLRWLGVKPDLVKNTSDDIEILYNYGEELINLGELYLCTCKPDIVKRNRAEGRECTCRSRSVDENYRLWREMHSTLKANEAIVRLKMDMRHKNTALRDPTMFRIVEAEHPLKKDRYRVWPTYDFAVAIEDSLDGVTHALRTKEYELRDELYYHLLNLLKLRRPRLIEFSRLEMKGTPVSKRFIKPLLEKGLVDGWSDPRLPTLIGLRRRGILPEAVREFVLSMGVSKVESEPTWDLLESFNRKILDPMARRYFFIPDPVRLEVKGAPKMRVKLRLHPDRELGYRELETDSRFYVAYSDVKGLREGELFRLIELYNVKYEGLDEGVAKGVFYGTDLMEGVVKIQWVTEHYVEFKVLIPSLLYIDDRFNEESLKIVYGYAEEACRGLSIGDAVQFVRFGFCRIDAPNTAILTHR